MHSLSPDETARFAYLALIGMAVASGLFWHYRGRLSGALQHAAIWILIILGATLAFGLKDELARQLFPDEASAVGEGTIALRRAGDGHFYARVEINGAPIRFMIDTGATNVVLTQDDARRAGIDLAGLSYVLTANTANGPVRGAGVRLDRVSLGGVTDADVPAVVNGGELQDSLLGMSYLDRFRKVSFEGDRLYLTR